MIRWNAGWLTVDLGRPFGKRPCRSIAATAANLTIVDSRTLIACSPQDALGEVYLAITNSFSGTSFAWSVYATPNNTWYQSVASAFRITNFINNVGVIDIYASGVLVNRLHKIVYNTSSVTIADQGSSPEGGSIIGGLAASAGGVYFVNSLNGRNYLSFRNGNNASAIPQYYRGFGDENVSGFFWSNLYAEGTVSMWGGTTAIGILRRPTFNNQQTLFPAVDFLYSSDEGDHLFAPVTVPNNGYSYVSDPTSVVTDQRTMYSVQVGVALSKCNTANATAATAYAVSTTPSTFPAFSQPIQLETVNLTAPTTPLDHPYAEIEHRAGLADSIHIAWWVTTGSTAGIRYRNLIEGDTSSNGAIQLRCSGGPPRVTATDSGHAIVYYPAAGSVSICELNASRTGCIGATDSTCNGLNAGWTSLPYSSDFYQSPDLNNCIGPGIPGTSNCIWSVYPVSMAVNQSGNTLYYCFTRLETNALGPDNDGRQETDVYCTTATRDPVSGIWSWNSVPTPVGPTNDDRDQFAPEVVLTQESSSYTSGTETAIITFYDKADDPGNRYYKVRKAISTDRLATVQPPRVEFGGIASDPDDLPQHCRHTNARFIGDYAGGKGSASHSQTLSVVVPTDNVTSGQIRTDFNALGRWDQ